MTKASLSYEIFLPCIVLGNRYLKAMEKIPFDLMDLVPTEAVFTTSGHPTPLTLCKWTLRVRNWAEKKYSSAGLDEMFRKQQIEKVADVAWFMLKEKAAFKTYDDFLDAFSTPKDQLNLITALLATIGIGEPEIKKINDDITKAGGNPDPNG